jgi:hypothetical protein
MFLICIPLYFYFANMNLYVSELEWEFSAILLHGVCYDFLFIAGQLYVDEEANERIRGAAQGLIAFILWGLGAFVGTNLAGVSQAAHTLEQASGTMAHDWQAIWIYPAW